MSRGGVRLTPFSLGEANEEQVRQYMNFTLAGPAAECMYFRTSYPRGAVQDRDTLEALCRHVMRHFPGVYPSARELLERIATETTAILGEQHRLHAGLMAALLERRELTRADIVELHNKYRV